MKIECKDDLVIFEFEENEKTYTCGSSSISEATEMMINAIRRNVDKIITDQLRKLNKVKDTIK